ncbi:MAG: GNAT family N-acetyltransferase [Propionibacteriaceae bacterium]|jgi:CubicO group peptidase (beta-lactamase class C family)|nr:GNAT family N-acetyltransferase [Propionibacteriaceae bacterium]
MNAPKMMVRLRPVEFNDLEAMTRVFLACWQQSYANVLPREVITAMTHERATGLLQASILRTRAGDALAETEIIRPAHLCDPTFVITVACSDTELLGFVSYGVSDAVGLVSSLYVTPDSQGSGVGRALLESAWQVFITAGVTTARLWAFADNVRGRAFYEHCGWHPDGETRSEVEYGPLELRHTRSQITSNTLAAEAAQRVLAYPDGPPGCVIGVWDNTGEWQSAGLGFSDAFDTPMTTELRFDLASLTKVVATTQCYRQMGAARELLLERKVADFLPAAKAVGAATLSQLLTHRAGLWEWQPLYLSTSAPWQTLLNLELRYPVGAARHYSDLGFILLGKILERITNCSLQGVVSELVTQPLGMTHTGFGSITAPCTQSATGDMIERAMVASGDPYPIVLDGAAARAKAFPWRTAPLNGQVNDGNCFYAFDGISGHAGLFSDVKDLSRFVADLSRQNDNWFADGLDVGQALGWRSASLPLDAAHPRLLYHTGFTGTALGFWPDSGCGVVLLTNRLLTSGVAPPTSQLLGVALSALLGEQAVAASGLLEGTTR